MPKTQPIIALCIFYLLAIHIPGLSASGKPESSLEDDQQFQIVSAPVVKNFLAKKEGLVINVLSGIEYELHHITGSVNIPLNKLPTSTRLPKDKACPIIFYCMGHR